MVTEGTEKDSKAKYLYRRREAEKQEESRDKYCSK